MTEKINFCKHKGDSHARFTFVLPVCRNPHCFCFSLKTVIVAVGECKKIPLFLLSYFIMIWSFQEISVLFYRTNLLRFSSVFTKDDENNQ
jgi:hypothetical protein